MNAKARLELRADEAVVVLSGDLDLRVADRLASLVSQAVASGRGRVVVEMGDVSFVDSAVMRVLLEGHRLGEAAGRPVVVRDLRGNARRMIELAGLHLTLRLDDARR